MHDQDIQQRFHLIQQEIEAAAAAVREETLQMTATIDSLRLELETIKLFMERYHPGFSETYAEFREEATQAVNPEWTAGKL